MHDKQIWTAGISLVWALIVFATPAWSHPHARSVEDVSSTGDDSEERLGAIAEHLMTEESQDAQCELGSEMGRIADVNQAELPKAKDETIKKVTSLIIGPTREGKAKCLTRWAASVLETIGPRVKFAVPALEKALVEADAAEARRKKTEWEGFNVDSRLDKTIRAALKAIDGKQR